MHKTILLALLLSIGLLSCNTSEKQIDKLELAKQYYQALNASDGNMMKLILTDSLVTTEMDDNYVQTFSRQAYIEDWLRWDSVFKPSYKILEIKQENDVVKATIAKVDKRILFLHEEPTVWNSVIRFNADKIISIERTNLVFNADIWERNRTAFLDWIHQNHPELNGFIYDQTNPGGLNYLRAMKLYKNRKDKSY